MDDLRFGTRNKRGDWAPNGHAEIAFFWNRPLDLKAWVKFLIGYVWPWNAFHMAVTLLYWHYLLPDWEVMRTLSWNWALYLYAINGNNAGTISAALQYAPVGRTQIAGGLESLLNASQTSTRTDTSWQTMAAIVTAAAAQP